MKKLKLSIEDLDLEMFMVNPPVSVARGTVDGHVLPTTEQPSGCATRNIDACSGYETRDALNYGCYASEGGGVCSEVCPSGPSVCDTGPEMCV